MPVPLLAVLAAAIGGGIAGKQHDIAKLEGSTSKNIDVEGILNQPMSESGQAGQEIQMEQLQSLRDLLTQGGDERISEDMEAGRGEQMKLMDMLRGAQQTVAQERGPTGQDIGAARDFASAVFAPQQEAMQQQFQQSETDTSRLAARLGRQVDDPILRAKLAQGQANQMAMLQAQQGAFTAQSAQQFQGQRRAGMMQGLSMQEQIANVRGGLASQALQNRQALLGMGQTILQNERAERESQRNFRLAAAGTTSRQKSISGGGLKGMMTGAIGGAGSMMGASDVRVKENITKADGEIYKSLDKIHGYEYNYKGLPESERKISVMAQDLEAAGLDKAVVEVDGTKYVKYDVMSEFLVAAVAEMHHRLKKVEENK